MMLVDEVTKAYLAGIVDGEGCITISKNGQGVPYLRFQLQMTDLEAIELISSVAGSKIYNIPTSNPKHKDLYKTIILGKKCQEFINIILPYLRIKRKQAEMALEFPIGTRHCPPYPGFKFAQETMFESMTELNRRGIP